MENIIGRFIFQMLLTVPVHSNLALKLFEVMSSTFEPSKVKPLKA